jgi:hypothetical protein
MSRNTNTSPPQADQMMSRCGAAENAKLISTTLLM